MPTPNRTRLAELRGGMRLLSRATPDAVIRSGGRGSPGIYPDCWSHGVGEHLRLRRAAAFVYHRCWPETLPAHSAQTERQVTSTRQSLECPMGPFKIRRGTVADAAVLAELAARTFSEAFAASNTPDDLDAHLRASFGVAQQSAELADPDVRTLVALQEGRLVAYAQVRRKSAPDCVVIQRPVELHRIYLLRSVHGTGLAARLLRESGIAARELGGETLWLGVWEHNDRALAFYRKAGFKTVGSHVFVVGSDRQTDLVLVGPPLCETDQDPAQEHP